MKSMIEGLDKKSLVRGMHTKNVFEDETSDVGKKVKSLMDNWFSSRGSNNNWAGKLIGLYRSTALM